MRGSNKIMRQFMITIYRYEEIEVIHMKNIEALSFVNTIDKKFGCKSNGTIVYEQVKDHDLNPSHSPRASCQYVRFKVSCH